MMDIKKFKLDYFYKKALMSEAQKKRINLRDDADRPDSKQYEFLSNVENSIIDFVNNGKHLYIHSTICGNGKTSWAIRMVQTYLEKTWLNSELKCKVLFINVPRYMLAIKDNIDEKSEYVEHIKKNILVADIVIWDEIGTKGLTQFEHENILSLINSRIDAGKTNIYTSNLTNEELHKALGNRLYSRIVNLSYDVEFKGADKRRLTL
jgi:DNA replication protein DnaC